MIETLDRYSKIIPIQCHKYNMELNTTLYDYTNYENILKESMYLNSVKTLKMQSFLNEYSLYCKRSYEDEDYPLSLLTYNVCPKYIEDNIIPFSNKRITTINNIKRKDNKMGIKSSINNYISTCSDSLFNYMKSSIKEQFGMDFEFHYNVENFLVEIVVKKFLKKYDKKYKKHVSNYKNLKEVIVNNQFFIKLDNHTFIYVASGNKISLTKREFNKDSNEYVSPVDLYLYIFGRNANKYIRELSVIIKKFYNDTELGIYTVDADSYLKNDETMKVLYSKMKLRFLDTLFFSHKEKEIICNHIDKFNDNEKFYEDKQLLYKTGILLYGEPGTGKSSLVKALATKYNRSIINVNMSNIKNIDLNRLTQSINVDESRKYIILLEDIDTLFLNRVNKDIDKEDQCVINKLLQFLDSNTSPNNVIFIATTNHKERLDEALLREGRFDLKVEIKPLRTNESIKFASSFGLREEDARQILTDIDNEFNIHDKYNQSKLQTRILSKIENKSLENIKNKYGE